MTPLPSLRPLLLTALLLCSGAAVAQEEAAALVADELLVTSEDRLVATGNVQAFFEGSTLSAARVTYDRAADRLLIEGPILIRDPDGTVLSAERAELDPRLEDGILQGARIVLDRQLQIAANRVDRQGDLTALTGAAATSCQVCPGRAPLWEIRAGSVLLDEVAEQIHFEDARILIRGVPVLWLPRLRLPAPGNDRASGFLLPRIRRSGELGLGVQLPYFWEIGPSRDLTLAPLVSAQTLTLDLRYREAFLNGDLELRGAVSRDRLSPRAFRGYLSAEGAFRLPARLDLAFDLSAVSDADYPGDYGLVDDEPLESLVRLARVDGASLFEAELVHARSLDGEGDANPFQGFAAFERRVAAAGGTLTFGASLDGVLRDGAPERDGLRVGTFAEWRRGTVLAGGVLLDLQGRVALDAFRFRDDPALPYPLLRAVRAAAVTLRWPLLRQGPGVTDLLEPVLSLGYAEALGDAPPNDDSRLPELDDANLHALSRLPGEDAVEEGGRLSLGLGWTRVTAEGTTTLAFGRLLRTEPFDTAPSTGLDGTASDWLVAGQADLAGGFALDARALLGDGLSLGQAEAGIDWEGEGLTLGAGWLRLPADATLDRPRRLEELSLDAELRASDRWTLRTEARFDLVAQRPERLGLGVLWRNECVEVDVSVARRYTSADDEGASTDFGLTVDLVGFSVGDRPRVQPGACRD